MGWSDICRDIRGVNHFAPYAETLLEMWAEYDHDAWVRDLSIARENGANTIRFWLSPEAYAEDPGRFLDALEDVLEIASSLGLVVIPGFFNAWPTDREPEWSVGHLLPCDMKAPAMYRYNDYVRNTIRRFGEDRRILMWETLNEPEQFWYRDKSIPPDDTLPFLEYWYAFIKDAGAIQPVTIGAMFPWFVEKITHCQDLLNFHIYDPSPEQFESSVQSMLSLSRVVQKPIFCSETVRARYPPDEGGAEAHYFFFEMQTGILVKHGIGVIVPWLVEGIAADTNDHRNIGLGNLSLFRTDGSARAGGEAVHWTYVNLADRLSAL